MIFKRAQQRIGGCRRAAVAVTAHRGVERLEGRCLLSAGDPDLTFGVAGVRSFSADGVVLFPTAIDNANGKTVVAGSYNNERLFVYRLDSAGKPDPTFGGGDGMIVTTLGTNDDGFPFGGVNGLAVQPANNKILVLTANDQIVRFNADGSVDFTFGGGDGVADPTLNDPIAMALAPDGKIVVAGFPDGSGADYPSMSVARLLADGSADPSFSGDGVFTGFTGFARAVAVQPDGKVLVTGADGFSGTANHGVGRINVNGTVDTTYGGGDGFAVVNVGSGYPYATDIAVDGAGRAVVAATDVLNNDVLPFRLKTDGSLDTLFAPLDFEGGLSAVSIRATVDGKVVVIGTASERPPALNGDVGFVARYTAAGQLDTTFGGGLGVQQTVGPLGDVQPDGRIVTAGTRFIPLSDVSYSFALDVARLLAAGGGADASGVSLSAAGLLNVTGTADNDLIDVVDLSDTGGPSKVRVRVNGYQRTFARSAVKSIRVAAGGGDDLAFVRTQSLKAPATLLGEAGNDRLEGGAGNDRVEGGLGDDVLTGDSHSGGPAVGNDVLLGGAGNDVLGDTGGANTLDGGDGNDSLNVTVAATAGSTLLGGNGNDTLTAGSGPDTLDGGAGNDSLDGGGGDDQLTGGTGDDALTGGAGNDRLLGGIGTDTLAGGAGDDRLDGGTGADRLFGNAGTDTADYGTRSAGVTVDLADAVLGKEGEAGEGDTVYSDVEVVIGGAGNDALRGSAADNVFYGNGGDDLLDGRGGNDLLVGGAGKDRLYGGVGDDTLYGNDAFADYLDGGTGTDKARKDDMDAIFSIEGFI
jgi:uncharacterized delta-60 repeat protein